MSVKNSVLSAFFCASIFSSAAFASEKNCASLPNWNQLKASLITARKSNNGGLNLDMWATIVNRDFEVCAVTFTGTKRGDQWPGSRVISAQKATTANFFSLPGLALSTGNLYSVTQPGGSLFGLQDSNPVNTQVAYAGNANDFGQSGDPMVGKRLGGINVFGGGLALYNTKGELVGGLGVSGDTSCADHNIAWKTRKELGFDYVPAGVSPANDDNIIYLADKESPVGFKHPTCGNKETSVTLNAVSKVTAVPVKSNPK